MSSARNHLPRREQERSPESRRAKKKPPPIIREPSLREAKQRYADSFATFLAWMLWVYIWLPLVSLVAWMIGFRQAWIHVFLAASPSFGTLLTYLAITLLLGGALILWGRYNLHRFRGVERRAAPDDAETMELSLDFDLPADEIHHLRTSQRAALGIDKEGVARELVLRTSVGDPRSAGFTELR